MSADVFYHAASGSTVKEAFNNAVEQASYDYGHAGYTGTIAEKNSFVVIPCPKDREPMEYADTLMDNRDERIVSKWGPAGAIKLSEEKWLFFGWASS